MDTDELIAHSRARFDHAAARRVIKEKYQARLLFAHAGGMWRAGPGLLTALSACPDDTAVLLDLYETPVRVEVQELRTMCQQRWQEQMNAWLVEYHAISQQR